MKSFFFLLVLSLFPVNHVLAYQTEKVNDGNLVIVSGEDMVGSFILRNQNTNPEHAEYEWILYKRDENKKLVEIESGSGITGDEKIWILPLVRLKPIEFGPFRFYWSGNTTGRGHVYFNYFPSKAKLEYCILRRGSLSETQESLGNCEFKLVQSDA